MTSPTPKDRVLYNAVISDAKKKFKQYPSLYASSWIVREYKKRGGDYKKSKSNSNKLTGIKKWYAEDWVQVKEYLTKKKGVDCGASNRETKACRPLNRVDETTPITIDELLKIHSRKDLIAMATKKRNDMDGRIVWKTGTFTPSTK